jgi:predicted DCC family thiol-disulfide oxidoreductase YuxK
VTVPVAPGGQVLLYDGTCGLCAESVQLVLRHDRRGTLKFAALQSAFGRRVRQRHPELDGVDSVIWVDSPMERGRVFVRSDAALRVARYLGGWWRLAAVFQLLPRPLRDAGYDLVAKHRHSLIGSGPTCLVPGPDVRERFLDTEV